MMCPWNESDLNIWLDLQYYPMDEWVTEAEHRRRIGPHKPVFNHKIWNDMLHRKFLDSVEECVVNHVPVE